MTVEIPIPKKVVLGSDIHAAEQLCVKLIAIAADHGFSEDDTFGIHMALEEAMVNAVKHGNQGDPSKKVTVEYLVNSEVFDVTITDQGSGFSPDQVPDPRDEDNLHKMSGRGVFLIRTYMDVVEYNQKGNQIHMSKRVKCDSPKQK
jgi:serine/threonine-protein kinase RsbW